MCNTRTRELCICGSREQIADKTDLESCDAHMTPNDLAFFLATHNYDATPEHGYFQLKIEDAIYKVVPNGTNPGLADISIMN